MQAYNGGAATCTLQAVASDIPKILRGKSAPAKRPSKDSSRPTAAPTSQPLPPPRSFWMSQQSSSSPPRRIASSSAATPTYLTLNVERLTWSAIAAGVVIVGVIVKNALDQAGWNENGVATYAGAPIFVVGWILVAIALSRDKAGRPGAQAGVWVASLVILVSAMVSSMYMSSVYNKDRGGSGSSSANPHPPLVWPILFGLAWLALGWLAGGDSVTASAVGLLGGACVIASMIFLLPLQRRRCVVDGPGMPLFVLGWTFVVFAHSVVVSSTA